jgi:lipid-A-disaccharide synthase-like uncharacterized protein
MINILLLPAIAVAGTESPAPSLLDRFMQWANVSHTWELWLVAFGVVAQALFFGRWIVQLLASERRGQSHVPPTFWWLSLIGASLLLVYYALRGEPVGLLGQSVGWVVYLRNLHLLRRTHASKPTLE